MISEIEKEVRKIIADKLGVNEEKVVPFAELITDLRAESLDLVELRMALEDELSLEIPDEEAERFKTVKHVVDYVESKI